FLAAEVILGTKGNALNLREVVLIFGVAAVNDSWLQRMAPDDLRVVILPRVEIFPIGPGREAPNRRQAAAVAPHRRMCRRIAGPEKCRNHVVESCRRTR